MKKRKSKKEFTPDKMLKVGTSLATIVVMTNATKKLIDNA